MNRVLVALCTPLLLNLTACGPAAAPPDPTPAPTRVTMSPPRVDPAPTPAPEPTVPESTPPPPTVALTFDDGPSPYTADILQILTDHDATATFFVLGAHLPGREADVTALLDARMSVQWHTHSHRDLRDLSGDALAAELAVPEELTSLGADPTCVRPPYGATNSRTGAAATAAGLDTVLWTVDTLDWATTDPDDIVDAALADLEDGAVILLHDGGGDRSATVAALPDILTGLADEGFTTVSMCQPPAADRP